MKIATTKNTLWSYCILLGKMGPKMQNLLYIQIFETIWNVWLYLLHYFNYMWYCQYVIIKINTNESELYTIILITLWSYKFPILCYTLLSNIYQIPRLPYMLHNMKTFIIKCDEILYYVLGCYRHMFFSILCF